MNFAASHGETRVKAGGLRGMPRAGLVARSWLWAGTGGHGRAMATTTSAASAHKARKPFQAIAEHHARLRRSESGREPPGLFARRGVRIDRVLAPEPYGPRQFAGCSDPWTASTARLHAPGSAPDGLELAAAPDRTPLPPQRLTVAGQAPMLANNVLTRYYTMKRRALQPEATEVTPLDFLCEGLLALRTVEEMRAFLRDLTTPAELEALTDRWKVVPYLMDEVSYR